MLCTTVVLNDMHTHVNSSYIFVCQLGADFSFLCVYVDFVFRVFFHVSLGHLVLAFVVLGLASLIGLLSQETGWEERLRNDRFCVEWDVKP